MNYYTKIQFHNLTILVILCAGILSACISRQSPTDINSQPTPTVDRLAPAVMPAEPSQADLGAEVYHQVCMACHGDFGQGLTDEWREVWREDANCWQSGCHGKKHPSHGFEIPKTCCPPVIGKNTLFRFENAQELFIYIAETMPWWNPGYLTRQEFWQVTAYLMRENGYLPDKVILDEGNAFAFKLHTPSPPPGDKRSQTLLVILMLSGTIGLVVIQRRITR